VIRLILERIEERLNQDPQQMYESINAKDTEVDTPLMWAAEIGKTNTTEILLEYGADLNIKNNVGETALHWASKGGYQEIIQLLLDKQAYPNIQDNNGKLRWI
jgi:ankyrin repeat protein